jgi:small nuclear ribonucleoprotein (snRNP)-like protein
VQAYDQHLNLVLSDVEEIAYETRIEEETLEEFVQVVAMVSSPAMHSLTRPRRGVVVRACRRRGGSSRCCLCAETV